MVFNSIEEGHEVIAKDLPKIIEGLKSRGWKHTKSEASGEQFDLEFYKELKFDDNDYVDFFTFVCIKPDKFKNVDDDGNLVALVAYNALTGWYAYWEHAVTDAKTSGELMGPDVSDDENPYPYDGPENLVEYLDEVFQHFVNDELWDEMETDKDWKNRGSQERRY